MLAPLTPPPSAPDPQLTQVLQKGEKSFVVSGRAEREAAEGEREITSGATELEGGVKGVNGER